MHRPPVRRFLRTCTSTLISPLAVPESIKNSRMVLLTSSQSTQIPYSSLTGVFHLEPIVFYTWAGDAFEDEE